MLFLYFKVTAFHGLVNYPRHKGVNTKPLTILGTDQYWVCRLRGFTHVDSSLGNDSELVLQVSLQASHCILLPWDILAAGIAANPGVSWYPHGLNVIANDLTATIVLGTGPNQSYRVFGDIQDLRLTWRVCDTETNEQR